MMKKMTFFMAVISAMIAFPDRGTAQKLTGFSDNKEYFFAFEDGVRTQLEYQPIQNYKTGLNLLAWNDNTGNFKVFYNNRSIKLQDGFVDDYFITDNYMIYRLDQQLKVFDNGRSTTLSAAMSDYAYGDSVVAWYDTYQQELRIYEDGQVLKVEDGLVRNANYKIKANANMIAWVNPQNYFKIRYQGETIELYYGINNVNFKVGQDIVAFYDPTYVNFYVFYKGFDYELGEFLPISYQVGDELIAYEEQQGALKAFWKGEVYEVSSFAPDYYMVKDGVIVYHEQGRFKMWRAGKSTTLEMYIPNEVQVHQNRIAWRDQLGGIKAFIDGEEHVITTEQASQFTLAGNTVQYYISDGRYPKVWLDGKTY